MAQSTEPNNTENKNDDDGYNDTEMRETGNKKKELDVTVDEIEFMMKQAQREEDRRMIREVKGWFDPKAVEEEEKADQDDPYDEYTLRKDAVMYDPTDSRETKWLFGKEIYKYLTVNKYTQEYQIAVFIKSENPLHYALYPFCKMLEEIMQKVGTPVADIKKLIGHLWKSGNSEGRQKGYRESAVWQFRVDMAEPAETLKLFYLLQQKVLNNDHLADAIGHSKSAKMTMKTAKNVVYHHKYTIKGILSNLRAPSLTDRENAETVTEYIIKIIMNETPNNQLRWQRAINQGTGIVKEMIELQTLYPIKKKGRPVSKWEDRLRLIDREDWTIRGKVVLRKRGQTYPDEKYKIYEPDQALTKFEKLKVQYCEEEARKKTAAIQRRNEAFKQNIKGKVNDDSMRKEIDLIMQESLKPKNDKNQNNNHNHNKPPLPSSPSAEDDAKN